MKMEERIRSHDWSRTPLGAIESWSPALRMMVRFLVANRFPLLLWWGPQYTCIYNDAYQPILGAKHPRALGAPVGEVWSEIWDVLQPLIDTPYRGGPATWNEDLEVDLQRHGFVEETHFTIAYSPVPDESVPGGIGGVLATVHEITEKVIAERRTVALRELGARLGAATTADDACRIAAETLASHGKDVPFALVYLVEDGGRTRLAGAAGASAPATWPLGDTHLTRVQLPGSDAPAIAVTIPSNRPGEPAGLMVLGLSARLAFDDYYRDFIELACTQVASTLANARALEEERRRAEALAAIDRAKTAFFSNVSHEFRTPLTLMLGPLEDALARTGGALSGASLDTAYRNALRLLKLVNSLLDFARIEAGRMQASFVAVDLATVTRETASMFVSAFDAAGLGLHIDCELDEPVFVDRELWEKVLLNLMSNALKFTFDGEVEVKLRRDGERAVLSVRDTGVGVPAHELPRLFERFHRVEGARSRTHEGSGIGLALVKELVALHGGELAVASTVDVGTTFTVALPFGTAHLPADRIGAAATLPSTRTAAAAFVQEAEGWRAQADTAPAPTADPATRVLVVDDNADMRGYIARLLRERWSVEVAPDGATGLAMIRERHPALVITDVMMPGIDGFALVRALRDDPATRSIPVIMLSARAGEESRVDGLEAGADDYLIKPFSAKELVTRVATQLDLRRLRHQLATERAALASVFAHAPMPVATLRGVDMVYEFANPAYEQTVGGPVVGRRFADAFPAMASSVFVDIAREVLRTGEPQVRSEAQAMRDGKPLEVYFTYLCAPLSEDRVIVIAQDITSQVAANRAKDDFLAMLGHELRNPLAPMLTALQLMRLRGQDSREQDVLERQVGHLSRLVDDLLDVSRITRGKIDLRRRPVELLDVVMRAVELASPLIEQRRNHLDLRLPRTGLGVDADPERLAQVIANLLTNAAKYSNPGTPIVVSGARTNGHIELRVRDAGTGIAPEMLERVFDLFVQQRQTLSRARGGLGIGLSIARNLVELHGGTIRAHSDGIGNGSEFIIQLPALAIPVAAAAPRSDALMRTREQPSPGSRILLVDDNDDVVTTLRSALQSLGYTVETAHDGPSALEKARAFAPHIAVLDIGLPVMDGYELAKRLRQEPGRDDLRLIAVTGYGQETDRRRAREAGFARHLVKPVDLVVLASIVKELHARG
jgi:signal transduction histidine kinase